MAEHNELGRLGEDEAILHLMLEGYTLLARNWRVEHLEIDIVAEWHGEIVFVEVKTRSNEQFASAVDAVNLRKKLNLIAAGRAYLALNHLRDVPYSYDIITVVGSEPPFKITHLRHAYNESDVREQFHKRRPFKV